MENNLIETNDTPTVPGIGIAGTVMCPFGFQKSPCLKGGCELWVELDTDGQKVGRCSLAWMTILGTEVRGAIDRLNLKNKNEVKEE